LKSIEYNEVNEEIIADAGMMLPDLSRFALYNSIYGFAGLEGVPGTLGGAVFMNAGAYGYEIKDTLVAVDIASYEGEVHRYSCAELELGHRNSALRKNEIEGTILRCYFTANKGDAEEISNEMEFYHAKRHKYQDFLYPNLGSIFSRDLRTVRPPKPLSNIPIGEFGDCLIITDKRVFVFIFKINHLKNRIYYIY
jgi:UDP-N-acetylmuramate dehydrogenase